MNMMFFYVLTVPLPKRLIAQAGTKKEPKKSRDQIMLPIAQMPGHRPSIWLWPIAPARNQVLRDELIPCQANIESKSIAQHID